ncbi:MAG: glycosyltransferase family 39 protein [Acidobacteria bacterium]|nr:glycosyltransferase family 39 protein [Acidobacteriota bacterium]
MRRFTIATVALVFGLALGLRLLAMALAFDPSAFFDKFPLLAQRLIADGWIAREPFGYSPAYIYFLALLIRAGATPAVLCVAQAVMGACTCVLIGEMARRMSGAAEGVVAGILAAAFGPFLIFSIELESDGLGLFLYCAAATALMAALDRPAAWRFAAAGVLLGLRAAQRPDALVLVALAAVLLGLAALPARGGAGTPAAPAGRPGWPALAAPAWLLAGCLVPVLPITWQNERASGELIPVTSSGGWVFYTSQNHAATGLSYFPPPLAFALMNAPPRDGEDPLDRLDDRVSRRVASLGAGRELSPGAASRFWRAEGWRSIRRRGFIRQLGLQARKIWYLLHAYEGHDNLPLLIKSDRLGLWQCFGMGILAPLALLGLALRPPRRLAVLAFLLVPAVSMSLFYVGSRFRLELEAMILPFAAAALVWLARRARALEWRKMAAAAAVLSTLAVLLHVPDREIVRQRRLRFIRLHTFLGERAASAGQIGSGGTAEAELGRAAAAALHPAEAEGAWRGLARLSRGRGHASAAERYDALASGLLDGLTRQRLEARSADADALWAVGRHWMLRGEMSRAAEVLARAARLAPDDPDILLTKALAAFEAGTASPGEVSSWTEEALRIGLRLSPNAATAYRLAARCDEKLGRRDAAEAALRQAALFEAAMR